jgi:hypothetical protein
MTTTPEVDSSMPAPKPARERPTHFISRWLICRGIGAVFFVAFVSFWLQAGGLIGSNGITPYGAALDELIERVPTLRWYEFPTVFWLGRSDAFMHCFFAIGVLLSLLAIAGVAQPICLAALWFLYLSLQNIASPWLGYQWDALLLEAGFLSVFFASFQLLPRTSRENAPSIVMLWMFRILLFRLMFSSGIVKLNDPTWTDWKALLVHYETQPLPTALGWYAHNLPEWFNRFSVPVMFFIEIVAPFGIFGPRIVRSIAGFLIVFLMILIMLTGNYCFFNVLTLLLCLSLYDDRFFKRFAPARIANFFQLPEAVRKPTRASFALRIALAIVIGYLGLAKLIMTISSNPDLRNEAYEAAAWADGFNSVNTYGLFAHMTTVRPEIIIEGSDDGMEWKPYEFRYKPGEINARPKWAAPHQPRLDWQMWFAALGSPDDRSNAWIYNLLVRILQGKEEVLDLLATDPFPNAPPRFVRASMYQYDFTDWKTGWETHAWWTRRELGTYIRPMSLSPTARAN